MELLTYERNSHRFGQINPISNRRRLQGHLLVGVCACVCVSKFAKHANSFTAQIHMWNGSPALFERQRKSAKYDRETKRQSAIYFVCVFSMVNLCCGGGSSTIIASIGGPALSRYCRRYNHKMPEPSVNIMRIYVRLSSVCVPWQRH